jgi:hypothetical protein
MVLSEKIIEEDLSRVEESATNPHRNWVLGLRDVRIRVKRVFSSLFLPPTTIRRRKASNPPKLTTHPIPSHPSTSKEM